MCGSRCALFNALWYLLSLDVPRLLNSHTACVHYQDPCGKITLILFEKCAISCCRFSKSFHSVHMKFRLICMVFFSVLTRFFDKNHQLIRLNQSCVLHNFVVVVLNDSHTFFLLEEKPFYFRLMYKVTQYFSIFLMFFQEHDTFFLLIMIGQLLQALFGIPFMDGFKRDFPIFDGISFPAALIFTFSFHFLHFSSVFFRLTNSFHVKIRTNWQSLTKLQ